VTERQHGGPDATAGSGARRAELRRLAHDVRNALNGVSVNLEVARTRAARPSAEAAQLVAFLDTAAQQLELAARLHKQFTDLATAVAHPS